MDDNVRNNDAACCLDDATYERMLQEVRTGGRAPNWDRELPADPLEREFRIRMTTVQAGNQINGETAFIGNGGEPFSREAVIRALELHNWETFAATFALMGRD
jgi:hypothetical protein